MWVMYRWTREGGTASKTGQTTSTSPTRPPSVDGMRKRGGTWPQLRSGSQRNLQDPPHLHTEAEPGKGVGGLGRELVEAREDEDGDGEVSGGEGEAVAPRRAHEAPISQNGDAANYDLQQ